MAAASQGLIARPDMTRVRDNIFVQRPPISDSSNAFSAGDLVTLTAGVLVKVATDGVLLYGQVLDRSHTASELPPDAFFGENHYVLDPRDCEFEINVGSVFNTTFVGTFNIGTGADNLQGTAAKTPGDVVIGTSYGLWVPSTGIYSGFQFLDPTETTATLFTVTAKVDNNGDTVGNGRVRVKPIESKIQ